MSGTKGTSRLSTVKKDGGFRYATRFLALEKNKKNNSKESGSSKGCDCPHKTESGGKGSKTSQNSKLLVKKGNSKCSLVKDSKKKSTTANHREKVVIVSKRSSSVSVVKSCNLRKSVSVRKVSYSTSVVLSSDEDTDSEDDSEEEEKKEVSKKRKTILKHTTSKVKSNVRETKKTDEKSAQRAKALKLLCNKLSYDKHNERELRPRFPYNMLQEWPTARTHRMASLNALAKVHVLYENEGRTVGENLNDADESSLIDFLNENSDVDDDEDDMEMQKESKPLMSSNSKRNEKNDKPEKSKKATENDKAKKSKGNNKAPPAVKAKVTKRGKKRKLPEVEIIDTRICKRMASLNAQAILAASYLTEPKPKRVYNKKIKKDSDGSTASNCGVTVIKTEIIDDDELTEQFEPIKIDEEPPSEITEILSNKTELPSKKTTSEKRSKNWSMESEVSVLESSTTKGIPSNRTCLENSIVSSTASTKVGVTQYTEVTKVQINTNKETEIKEESKSERKIEHIISNDDVAITQMYHYQSKSTNESYCLQMQTTYKPASKSMSPSIPSDRVYPYMKDPTILPGSPGSYYGRDVILPPQSYPSLGPIPAVGDLDHRLPRQYGSAFTVPHYRQPPRMPFAHTDYGYFQPAGPLIQPSTDQRTIHKPVPYHPQPNLLQPPQRPQQPSSHHRDGFHSSFESHHSSKLSLSPKPQPLKPLTSPPSVETPSQPILSPSTSSQFPRPADDAKVNRSLGSSSTSFNQPPSKHVRSPVMPTLYSSQHNFRAYQTQKRTVPNNSLSSYHSERKEPKHSDYESSARFTSPHSTGTLSKSKSSRESSGSRKAETQPPHSSDHFKNLTKPHKDRTWALKNQEATSVSSPSLIRSPVVSNLYSQDTRPSLQNPPLVSGDPLPHMFGAGSSHFIPYQDSKKGLHEISTLEPAHRAPTRPPSVIEIVEDTNTKTYIQLEVPRNSHREKIVVVDIEDDEVEKKLTKEMDPTHRERHVERSTKRSEKTSDTKKRRPDSEALSNDLVVKVNKVRVQHISKDETQPSNHKQTDVSSAETPDVMVLEVKKRKESAVVRRARLHGKQRTFRDCYNRPLEQLLQKTRNLDTETEAVEKLAETTEKDVSETDAKKTGSEKNKDQKNDDITIISEQSLPPNMQPLVLVPRYVIPKLEKTPFHGWTWEGSSNDRLVYISNDEPPCMRRCYPAVRHVEGDLIRVRDCVFLRSGPRKTDVPFVAKVTALWGNPTNGDMTMSLLWYYRPEHTETIKKTQHSEDEIFASKHRDTNSVACIEDKCYALTYFEYCRYKKRCKLQEEGASPPVSIVPHGGEYFRENRLPPSNVSPDLVLFCRKVYDYRQRRLLKNPL